MTEHTEDMELRREGGLFVQVTDNEPEACEEADDGCPTDDDPGSEAIHPPGTVDDVPYSLGQQEPEPADFHVGSSAQDASGGPVSGEPGEMMAAEQGLISIDEEAGYNVQGFSANERTEIAEALGDDAAEPLPDNPGGTSATGSVGLPDRPGD